MVITPTNHTTGAFFGDLDDDEQPSISIDEQSSIDCSQMIDEPSMGRKPLNNGLDSSNVLARDNVSVLESVLEDSCPQEENHTEELLQTPQSTSQQTRIFSAKNSFFPVKEDPSVSNATNASTACPLPRTVPSRTIHTSNVDALTYKQMEEESERFTAWAIHVVLGVFCFLVISSVLLSFVIIQSYGLVAMMGLLVVLVFTIFLAWFVDQTILSKESKLKPIRQQIIRVVEVAKQAMVEEFHLLKRDWNNHFLLMNGDSDTDDLGNERAMGGTAITSTPRPVKKKRSAIFKAIKPAFGFGRRMFRRRGKAKQTHTTGTRHSGVYHPPNAENGVIA